MSNVPSKKTNSNTIFQTQNSNKSTIPYDNSAKNILEKTNKKPIKNMQTEIIDNRKFSILDIQSSDKANDLKLFIGKQLNIKP